MDDQLLQYALIAATIVGTIVAVLVGRILDKGETSTQGVIAIRISDPEVLDLTQRKILLAPQGLTAPVERIFEREFEVANVGFVTIHDFSVLITARSPEPYDKEKDFIEVSFSSNPSALEWESEALVNEPDYDEIRVKYKFMNRSDWHRIRFSSSKVFSLGFSAHHPNTRFEEVSEVSLQPTLRQRVGNFIASSRIIEALSFAVAAGAAAAGLIGH